MKTIYSLRDIFWDIRFQSYKKSDLLKRLNDELIKWWLKPLKQKELNKCWFYIVKDN